MNVHRDLLGVVGVARHEVAELLVARDCERHADARGQRACRDEKVRIHGFRDTQSPNNLISPYLHNLKSPRRLKQTDVETKEIVFLQNSCRKRVSSDESRETRARLFLLCILLDELDDATSSLCAASNRANTTCMVVVDSPPSAEATCQK